jgi:hypothetical protein
MSKIQIKRYNAGTSTWESQFPITKAQHLVATSDGTTTIFDENDKLKINYLPNDVFDNLRFTATLAGSNTLRSLAIGSLNTANVFNRSPIGIYWVASSGATITNNFTAVSTTQSGYTAWVKTYLTPSDNGLTYTTSDRTETLEAGDWVVISRFEGAGTEADPYVVFFGVVENTYETATTDEFGIVRLSNQTVYANLAGNRVITDAGLKALIDSQNFANTSHTHLLAAGATDVTATASELNLLDGELITTTELNYLAGVTSSVQTQLNDLSSRVRVYYDGTPTGMVTNDLWFDAV